MAPGPPASAPPSSADLSTAEPEEQQPAGHVEDTAEVAPTEDIPLENMPFDDTPLKDVSFDKGGNWSGEDLSIVGEGTGKDLLGDQIENGETASAEMTGYDLEGEPRLAEGHRSDQGPAPVSPTSRVVGGVLIAGAVLVMVVGALRRRSTPTLPRRP